MPSAFTPILTPALSLKEREWRCSMCRELVSCWLVFRWWCYCDGESGGGGWHGGVKRCRFWSRFDPDNPPLACFTQLRAQGGEGGGGEGEAAFDFVAVVDFVEYRAGLGEFAAEQAFEGVG